MHRNLLDERDSQIAILRANFADAKRTIACLQQDADDESAQEWRVDQFLQRTCGVDLAEVHRSLEFQV